MIRKANLDDLDDVVELLSHLAPNESKESIKSDMFCKIVESDWCDLLIWETEGKIVSTGSLWIMQKVIRNFSKAGQIEDVVTLPEYRGCGFGRMIIDALVTKAKERGCYKVVLNCSDHNVPFYEKCGFRKTENQMRIDL